MRLVVTVAGFCFVAMTLGSCDPSAPGEGETQAVVLSEDVSAGALVSWDHIEIVSDRSVVVHYSAGDERCSSPERVEIRYGEDQILVGLYEGRPTDVDAQPCLDQAVEKELEIDLDYPIDDRGFVRSE